MAEYAIHIEEIDTYTGVTRRYYMRDASDARKVALVSKHVAQHVCANMGNDFRYRRHATMHAVAEAQQEA